ncbi:hypothetical protein AAHA92_25174 [Salvia divinorum]|uniref:Uncharacterized protein n=1 Tax=Salvia divinorum TaxID=28513 RepID=A0ABD1GAF8_SALDI
MKIELTAHAHALYSLFSPSSSSPNFPKLTLPKCIIHLDSRLWLLPLCAVNSATPAVAPMLLLIAWGAARHLYLTAEPPSCPRRRAAASLLQRPDVPVRVLPPTGISGTPLRQQHTASRSRRLVLPLRHAAARKDAPLAPKSQSSSVASGRAIGILAVVARSLYRCCLPSPLLGRPIEVKEHAKQHTLGDLGLWWEMECSRFWTPGLELVCQH